MGIKRNDARGEKKKGRFRRTAPNVLVDVRPDIGTGIKVQ